MAVDFLQYTQGLQCQEKMSAFIHLSTAELERDFTPAVVSKVVFWYSFRSKAASKRGECVFIYRSSRTDGVSSLLCCPSCGQKTLVSASANVGLKRAIKRLDLAYLYQNSLDVTGLFSITRVLGEIRFIICSFLRINNLGAS